MKVFGESVRTLRALAAFSFVMAVGVASAQQYHITDLGSFSGRPSSDGYGINNLTQVVGTAQGTSAFAPQGLFWSGSPTAVGIPNALSAFGINDNGQVTGSNFSQRAYIWKSGVGSQDIGALPGDSGSEGWDINNVGQVAGRSFGPGRTHAFVWTPGTGMQQLDPVSGSQISEAYAINQGGLAVGESLNTTTVKTQGTLWSGGIAQALPYLAGGDNGNALDINDAGVAVGWSTDVTHRQRAVIWTGGVAQDLGVLPGMTDSAAVAINNFGVVVGVSGTTSFIWTSATGMIDANTLLEPTTPANWRIRISDINDLGEITGTLNRGDPFGHAFLGTIAVPEPFSLFGLATGVLVVSRRLRRKR